MNWQDWLADNQHRIVSDTGADIDAPARRQLREAARSKLAREFETRWRQLGGPRLQREYRFHPERRWRADYAHLSSRVLIEVQGGIWQRGRHTRGTGYQNDCEKLNAAQICGWRVFWIATGMCQPRYLRPIIECIEAYMKRGKHGSSTT